MNTTTVSGTFTATLDSLGSIRKFISDSGRTLGLDSGKTYKLSLAVDEIATNIINHGYTESGIKNGRIDITVSSDDKVFSVTLEDTAVPFNPLESKIPDEAALSIPLEQRTIGGLGIMLARENVDEFRYHYSKGKNINTFCVNLK